MADEPINKLALLLEDRIMQGDLGKQEILVAIGIKRLMLKRQPVNSKSLAKVVGSDDRNIRRVLEVLENKSVITREGGRVEFTLGGGSNIPAGEGKTYPQGRVESTLPDATETTQPPLIEVAPKLSLETTSRNSPLTPLGEGEVEQKWIVETFGISSKEEVESLNDKTRQALGKFLAHPVALRARALYALSRTTEPVFRPYRFVMALLENPVDLPALPESNIIDFEKPHEWAHKPWACLYKPKEFKGREHQEVLGLGDIVDRFGTGNFHETDRIYRAQGFEAAMDYIWDHHPRNGHHKNARAQ